MFHDLTSISRVVYNRVFSRKEQVFGFVASSDF